MGVLHRSGSHAAAQAGRGLAVVGTGGPSGQEHAYLNEVWSGTGTSVRRADGQLTWPHLAALLSKARVYVGPDTSVTHLAAASGCPTVALYGPTDPRLWGPWPAGGLAMMWDAAMDQEKAVMVMNSRENRGFRK
jgi:heptosyltransferase-3